jgi:CBS domain-containing protein
MNDLCCWVASLYDELNPTSDTTKSFDYLFESAFKQRTVQELINFSETNYCYPLKLDCTFRDILECMSRKGCHRVPIVDKTEHGKLRRFVTQSQVVQFIATHIQEFGSVLDTTLMNTKLGSSGIKALSSVATTADALKYLHTNKISGFPIVDEKGAVVNCFSVRDLRYFSSTKYADRALTMNICDFLEEVRSDSKYMAPKTVATCSFTDTMRTIITKMNGLRIHRLFVVAHDNIPIGVVTLTDALKFIISHEHIWDEHQLAINKKKAEEKEAKKEMDKEKKRLAEVEKHLEKTVKASLVED